VRDVVVVGSGHNALVAACYLAREGLDVEVLERDTVIGGAVSTVERWPGYLVDRGSSLHVMVRHTGIVEELDLAGVGLRYLDVDPWGFLPVPGATGGGVYLQTDLDATLASIEDALGTTAAQGYQRFVDTWAPRQQRLLELLHAAPTLRALGAAGRREGQAEALAGKELAASWLAPASAALDALGDGRLAAGLAWLAAQSGPAPHEPGTAGMLGWIALLHRRSAGRPVGGSGALTAALASRFVSYGGTLSAGDAVTSIATGRSRGVRTASGREIGARTVLAGCHIAETWRLLGRPTEPARSCDGTGLALRLGTTSLPAYADAKAPAHHGMQLLVDDRQQLVSAHRDAAAGTLPGRPPVLVMTPSATDPSLAPPGRHVVTVWGQWHPHDLRGGWTREARAAAAGRMLDVVEDAAPGFRSTIEFQHLQAPPDLERELGLVRGDLMHVAMTADQMFAGRPRPGWSAYRTPVPGLYVTGASTHPGGGVWGASGRTAAQQLLRDRSSLSHRLLGRATARTGDTLGPFLARAARRAVERLPGEQG
jgi:phytoene dehydrogenase-like protein